MCSVLNQSITNGDNGLNDGLGLCFQIQRLKYMVFRYFSYRNNQVLTIELLNFLIYAQIELSV